MVGGRGGSKPRLLTDQDERDTGDRMGGTQTAGYGRGLFRILLPKGLMREWPMRVLQPGPTTGQTTLPGEIELSTILLPFQFLDTLRRLPGIIIIKLNDDYSKEGGGIEKYSVRKKKKKRNAKRNQ